MKFTANTENEKKEMLSSVGVSTVEELFKNIPSSALFSAKEEGILKKGISEMEVLAKLKNLSLKNLTMKELPGFLGAGCYHHYIPAVVPALISRGEFLTAYTPYQPEASQGTLQATFEFQTMIADLYGMDVANASLYDGASALAEAALLALRETGRKKILVSKTTHPEYRLTLKTYCNDFEIVEIPYSKDGTLDLEKLNENLGSDTACVIIQNPNFFGLIEDGQTIGELSKKENALFIVSANPISLGILNPPGQYGADIAIGEGQPLGIPLNYGGPYLGLFSCKEKHLRKVPGRIVGITKDLDGKRGFVLTLQTREQHIRREKATSNICTNEALMALAATIYLSALGPKGLKELAELNLKKAHLLSEEIKKIPDFELKFSSPFFNEFVVQSKHKPETIQEHCLKNKIKNGLNLSKFYPELENAMLWCVTEMNSTEQIRELVSLLKKL